MKITDEKTVLATITERYDQIFKAEKKVADFILRNPHIAVNANVSELATYSGVSDATVIRLCKHLGYQGYFQMRICLSRDIGSHNQTKEKKPEETSFTTYFKNLAKQLASIGESIDEEIFRKCVELIRNSSMVHLAAVGNTSPFAMYMGFRLERIGLRASYNQLPEYFINHINLAEETDVLIAISWSGTSISVIQAMELAKKRGVKTIVLTGYDQSPLSKLADYVLVSKGMNYAFDGLTTYSHLNEMMIIEALMEALEHELVIPKEELEKNEMLLSGTKL